MDNKETLELLLQLASKKLGTTPEELKESIENGDLEKVKGSVRSSDAEKLKQIMQNPELASELLSTPQARMLMNLLQKRKQ